MAFPIGHPEKILFHLSTLESQGRISLIPREEAFEEFNRASMGEMPQPVGQITQESKGV
jgi:hypothetical protein